MTNGPNNRQDEWQDIKQELAQDAQKAKGQYNREPLMPRRRWSLWMILLVIGVTLLAFRWIPGLSFWGININGSMGSYTDIIISESNIPAFNSVDIATSFTQIEFIQSDYYGLEIRMPDVLEPEWKVTGGCLNVHHNANISLTGMGFVSTNLYHVKVYYPRETVFDDVRLKSSSGDIKFPKTDVRNLSINTSSGDITANAAQFTSAILEATSGDIRFTGYSENGLAEMKASSGDIKASVTGAAQVDIAATSGDVTATTMVADQVNITTSSGDIEADVSGSGTVRMKATSGKVKADVDGCNRVDASTSSGNITIKSRDNKATDLSVKATSGNVRVEGIAWTGFQAETSSGDIRVSGALIGETSVKATSGKVEIQVPSQVSQYGYDLRTTSGSVYWNGERMDKSVRSSGSYENHINTNTTSGNIRVDFNNR